MDAQLMISKYKKNAGDLVNKIGKELEGTGYFNDYKAFKKDFEKRQKRERINIVFIGGYSVGKSSIIRELIGDESIKVDTAETTDRVTSYEYNGIDVTDTPGLYTRNAENNRKTREAIRQADFIFYCITVHTLFNEETKKEFIELLEDDNLRDKVFLVINKLGDENTVDGNNLSEIINEYTDNIEDVLGSEYFEIIYKDNMDNMQFCSAKLYREGRKSNDEEMIRFSKFTQLAEKINEISKNNSIMDKCLNDAKFIKKFTNETEKKIKADEGDEDAQHIREEEYISCIEKMRNNTKREIARCHSRFKNSVCSEVYKMLETGEDVNEYINGKLEECFSEMGDITYEQFKKRFDEELNYNPITNKTQNVFAEDKKKNGFFSSGTVTNGWNGLMSACSRIDKLSESVSLGKKYKIFGKTIMSGVGGKGTTLFSIIEKRFGTNVASKLSPKIAKTSGKLSKLGKGFGTFVGLAVSVGSDIMSGLQEHKREKIKRTVRSEYKSIIVEQLNAVKDKVDEFIDDFCNTCVKNAGAETSILSGFFKLQTETDRLISEIENEINV